MEALRATGQVRVLRQRSGVSSPRAGAVYNFALMLSHPEL